MWSLLCFYITLQWTLDFALMHQVFDIIGFEPYAAPIVAMALIPLGTDDLRLIAS